jgi:hypothetical protein
MGMTREDAVKGLRNVADWHYGKYEQTHEEDYLNDGDFLTAVANMLKEQVPRVMTLEEVKMLDSDYYYLESMRSPGKELREIVGAYGLTCVTWPSITWARQTMGDSGYGKTWRCWTSRPDEKRRAETPWDS